MDLPSFASSLSLFHSIHCTHEEETLTLFTMLSRYITRENSSCGVLRNKQKNRPELVLSRDVGDGGDEEKGLTFTYPSLLRSHKNLSNGRDVLDLDFFARVPVFGLALGSRIIWVVFFFFCFIRQLLRNVGTQMEIHRCLMFA